MEKIKVKRPSTYSPLLWDQCQGTKLNLGCGFNHLKGCMNIDSNPNCFPDMCFNIEKPWPIETDSVDYVCSINVFEHLKNFYFVLGEIHRVCKTGAMFEIIVPNYSHESAFVDPTHVRFFGQSSHEYFAEKTYSISTSWYTPDRFNFICEAANSLYAKEVFPLLETAKILDARNLSNFQTRSDGKVDLMATMLLNMINNRCINIIRYLHFRFKVAPLSGSNETPKVKEYY